MRSDRAALRGCSGGVEIRGRSAPRIFPDSKRGTYVLPVKKEIRGKAGLAIGDRVEVELTVL